MKPSPNRRTQPSDPDYGQRLLEAWGQHLPEVDASSIPLFSMATALGRQMELFLEGLLKPLGYQLSDYRLMVALLTSGEEDLTPVQLNGVLRQTSAGITKTISRIEQQGLVIRQPNPDDSRSVVIKLTAEGEEVIRELCVHVAREQNKKLAWLPDEERETALAGMAILLQVMS